MSDRSLGAIAQPDQARLVGAAQVDAEDAAAAHLDQLGLAEDLDLETSGRPELLGYLGHPGRSQRRRRAVRQVATDGRGPRDRLAQGHTGADLVGNRVGHHERERGQGRLVSPCADEVAPPRQQHTLDDHLREQGGGEGEAFGQLDRQAQVLGHRAREVGREVTHQGGVDSRVPPHSQRDQRSAVLAGQRQGLPGGAGEAEHGQPCGVDTEVGRGWAALEHGHRQGSGGGDRRQLGGHRDLGRAFG